MPQLKKLRPEDVLRDHALKATPQRISVLKSFMSKKKVLSLPELNQSLGKGFDRITLYRTLNSFEEHGLIHKIPDMSGNITYALCRHGSVDQVHDDNHVHFKCTSCDITLCLEDVEIPLVKMPRKFKPEKYNFLVEGICDNCNKKRRAG